MADPLRAGHELKYFPGDENFRRADLVILNKMDQAEEEGVATVLANLAKENPGAAVVKADSPVTVSDPEAIRGKRVLVVEDGPTLTHGGMKIGAGTVAARQCGVSEIVDPRPWVTGEIAETFRIYPGIGKVLPAMGYGDKQIADLERTINDCDCDAVVVGTPIDLGRIVKIDKPSVRVTYELEEREPGVIRSFIEKVV